MKVVVVIQARTNSSRLPGKVLLPLGGMPIAVVAAKRASGGNKRVIVATSVEQTDDYLTHILYQHHIDVFRGDLDNVLKRYCDCLSQNTDDTVVVRLTADNVFPCSALIDELVNEFIKIEGEYLCMHGGQSGLPYGVAAEVMRLGKLREAFSECTEAFDLEHVTPFIRRKYGETYFVNYLSLDLGMHRCTIDSFDDYMYVVTIFNGVSCPISASVTELLKIVENSAPLINKNNKNLILGTAQLGLAYGIANKVGQPSRRESFSLLSKAVKNGMQYLDTANAYGESESIIGEWLSSGWHNRVKIITKLSPLLSLSEQSNLDEINHKVDESLYQSLISLQLKKLIL